MLTPDERREMITRIQRLPAKLREVLENLNNEQLDTPYGPGKWTPRQVAHHLADSHMNAFARMKLILTENHPTLKPYDQEAWAETIEAKSLAIGPSLSILEGLHARWCHLMESLSDADWRRSAKHPEMGEVTLDNFLGIYARHGERHVAQVRALREEKGW